MFLLDQDGCFIVKGLREIIDEKSFLNLMCYKRRNGTRQSLEKFASLFGVYNKKESRFYWLHHLGIDLNSVLCSHCGNEIETVEHYFLKVS